MLCKMVKEGYRRKLRTISCELSNGDILRRCTTKNIHQFITRQQPNFIAPVIRGEDHRMTKRLLFNNDSRKQTGLFVTFYKTVLENEKVTPDTFN